MRRPVRGGSASNGDASSAITTDASSTAGGGPFADCSKKTLEADKQDQQLAGPGVDPDTGALAPGHYVISSTYLAMVPEQSEHAQQLGGAVIQSLPSMQGLVASGFASSTSCATLRTLTVWQSEEDMVAFVSSPAHAAAMAQTSTLSRGSISNVISWEGDETNATWEEAAKQLAKQTGGDF